jgi:prevent-host-death family protein
METFSISEFKARCLAILERVRVTGESIQIVRHGQPVAQVIPPSLDQPARRRFVGRLDGQFEIAGDMLDPVISARAFQSGAKLPTTGGGRKKRLRR